MDATTGRPGAVDGRIARALHALLPLVLLMAIAAFACRKGVVSPDNAYALQQGRELLHQGSTTFVTGPTPHPLVIGMSTVFALFGESAAYSLMRWVFGYFALALLVLSVFRLARVAGNWRAGALAAALMATSYGVIVWTLWSSLDVLFAALVLFAVTLEVERPKRGIAVLLALGVAGLLRPEAWLLAGLYWIYLYRDWTWRARLAGAALVAAPATVWVGMDAAVMADPLFSFTHTESGADRTYGQSSRLENIRVGLSGLRTFLPLPLLLVATASALLQLRSRSRETTVLIAVLVVMLACFALMGLGGFPTNSRYLMVPAAILVILLAVFAVRQLDAEHSRQGRRIIVGVAIATLLALHLGHQLGPLSEARAKAARQARFVESASELADRESVTALADRCSSLGTPGTNVLAYFMYFLDRQPPDVSTADSGTTRRTDLFVAPGNQAVAGEFLTRPRFDADPRFDVPPSLQGRARNRDWILYGRSCR